MAAPLRVVFLGSDPIALPLLRWVQSNPARAKVVAVFTQPDRAVGRGQKIQANEIKRWAQGEGIPVLQPEKLTEDDRAGYASLAPDLALVMAYGHLLRDDFIAVPRLGTLNFHASLLPALRGASPIHTAVAEGHERTGVSLMQIVRRVDAGPVADNEPVSIQEMDTSAQVAERLGAACVPLLERNWDALAAGALAFHAQDEVLATWCRKLTREDARIDWRRPARLVAARINGLNPWPGASFVFDGHEIKVGLARALTGPSGNAGKVAGLVGDGLEIQAAGGRVALLRLQRPGGRMLEAKEFLRGFPIAAGAVLASADAAPLSSTAPFPKK